MRYRARHARRKNLGAALSAAGVIAGLLAGDAIGATATPASLASVDISNPPTQPPGPKVAAAPLISGEVSHPTQPPNDPKLV